MFGSGGGRIVSPCPLPHSTSNGTSCWEKEVKLRRLSTLSMTMLRGRSAPSPPIHESPLCVHPQVGTGLSSFFMHMHLFCLIHLAMMGASYQLSFTFFDIVESGVFSLCILGSGTSFPHAHVESLYLLPWCSLCKFFSLALFPKTGCCFLHVVNCVY